MTAEGHLIVAIASAIFAKRAELTPELAHADWWHLIPASLLTCLLPDIDHPRSFLGQRISWISRPVARLFGHRGFTHSLLAVFTGIMLLQLHFPKNVWVPADVFQGMILGYLSHIAADMLTPAGVPLLWPCRWRFRLPLLNSHKSNQLERILGFGLIILAIWFPAETLPFGPDGWSAHLVNIARSGFQRLLFFSDVH